MATVRRTAVRHANNLQTLHFHSLIAEHADSGRRNRPQIFAVVTKLLMISRDEIHAMRRHQLAQGLCRAPRVDGRSVEQIPRDKNRVRLFLQSHCDDAPEKRPVSHMPKMHIADQCRFSPAPGRRQVCESYRRSGDPRPVRVENSVESGHRRSTEQQFHGSMEVHVQPR